MARWSLMGHRCGERNESSREIEAASVEGQGFMILRTGRGEKGSRVAGTPPTQYRLCTVLLAFDPERSVFARARPT